MYWPVMTFISPSPPELSNTSHNKTECSSIENKIKKQYSTEVEFNKITWKGRLNYGQAWV